MELRTLRNGGKASLQTVADAWKREEHHFHWSEYPEDQWAVEMGHRLHDESLKALDQSTPTKH